MSPAQSVEKVIAAVTIANILASIFFGITHIIITVIGRTERLIMVALPIIIRKIFRCKSLIPQAKFNLLMLAY